MTIANLERHGFEVHDVEGWRAHYLQTLEHWIVRLQANGEQAEREVGRTKLRLWLLYFSLFALGFERGICGVFQTLASKHAAGACAVPPTRADLYA
jgi:cyclopropane-fatty-acyl-phospholipid synthase